LVLRTLVRRTLPLAGLFERVGPRFSVAAVKAFTPIASALGFMLMPSRHLPVKLLGGVAGLYVGRLGKKVLLRARRQAAKLGIAKLVLLPSTEDQDPILSASESSPIQKLLDSYGMAMDDLESYLGDIYELCLAQTMRTDEVKMGVVGKLGMVKRALQLSPQTVGQAHYNVAQQVVDRVEEMVAAASDPSSPSAPKHARHLVDKFLFLTDRVFDQHLAPGDRTQELARVLEVLELDAAKAEKRVLEVAVPFYRNHLEAALRSPESTSADMLIKIRKSLGISSLSATPMHLEGYSAKIQRMLERGELTDQDLGTLAKLRGMLSISQFEGDRSLEAFTAPLYREVVTDVIEEMIAQTKLPDHLLKQYLARLEERRQELHMPSQAGENVVKETLRRVLQGPFDEAVNLLRRGQPAGSSRQSPSQDRVSPATAAAIHKKLQSVIRMKDIALRLLPREKGRGLTAGILNGSPGFGVTLGEKVALHRHYMAQCLEDSGGFPDAEVENLDDLQDMMRLRDDDVLQAKEVLVGPQVRESMGAYCAAGTFSPEEKAEHRDTMDRLFVTQEAAHEMAMEFYEKQLLEATEGGTKIPSVNSEASLQKMSAFFSLQKEDLTTTNMRICGPIFDKVMNEALSNAEANSDPEDIKETTAVMEQIGARLGLPSSYIKKTIKERLS